MGKIFSSVFGGSGSKSKSQQTSLASAKNDSASWNDAYPGLQQNFGGYEQNGLGANNFLASLLGLNGSTEGDDAYNKYKESTGYQTTLDAGSQAITGNNAAKGLLNSGATLKGLDKFGQANNQQYYNGFLDKLLGLSTQGLSAGSLIGGAGQKSVGSGTSNSTSQGTSNSSSYSKPGLGQFLGSMMSAAAASDRRLKVDITPVGKNRDLTVYEYRYVWDEPDTPLRRGYMADEVETKYPEAIGPLIGGEYKTLYYDMLPEVK